MTHSSALKSHCQTLQSDSIQAGASGAPASCMTPAGADAESAHTNSAQASSLFMDSPSVQMVDGDGRTSAVTLHPTTRADRSLVLFRTFVKERDFAKLTDLCRERLDTARTSEDKLRWKKDFSIVKSLQGKYREAHDILASASWEAGQVTGVPRAKYHDEFGIVLIEHNRHVTALDHFDLAHGYHFEAGNITGVGIVDNNKALALEALGRIREAELAARSAVQIAAGCDPHILRECYDTWEKLDAKLRGSGSS